MAAQLNAATTFKAVGDEYLDKTAREGRAVVTIGKSRWLLGLMEPDLGFMPIADIKPNDLLHALRKIEAKGHLENARRMRSLAGRIFRYAVATSRATNDPSSLLRGALTAPTVKHHSAIIQTDKVGALLRAIEGSEGQPLTQLALRLTPHVFVRPGELRRAEWPEFDLHAAVWSIPREDENAQCARGAAFSTGCLVAPVGACARRGPAVRLLLAVPRQTSDVREHHQRGAAQDRIRRDRDDSPRSTTSDRCCTPVSSCSGRSTTMTAAWSLAHLIRRTRASPQES